MASHPSLTIRITQQGTATADVLTIQANIGETVGELKEKLKSSSRFRSKFRIKDDDIRLYAKGREVSNDYKLKQGDEFELSQLHIHRKKIVFKKFQRAKKICNIGLSTRGRLYHLYIMKLHQKKIQRKK